MHRQIYVSTNPNSKLEINKDNESVSSNDSQSNDHLDQSRLVPKKSDQSTNKNSLFNLSSDLEESTFCSINNEYIYYSQTYLNMIDHSSKGLHSNLEEDKSPNTLSNLENTNLSLILRRLLFY